jgi:hypothetical protein
MRRWPLALSVIVLGCATVGCALAQTTPSSSPAGNRIEPPDQSSGGNVLGSVVQGNTTIVFDAANPSDVNMQQLQTWDEFAASHPRIANALAYRPSLMNDPAYLSKHPDLNTFFQAHPEVREAMAKDPGDFAAIQPRPGE